jgi:hypothetical protein
MRIVLCAILTSMLFATTATVSFAAEYGWMDAFNATAQADPTGYKQKLADRFNIGQATITDVLHVAKNPADAYMLFRMGEMSSTSTEQVIKKYNAEKGKGWGALAKSMGIKPGSAEFHALKNGEDLYGSEGNSKDKNKDKGKNNSKEKSKKK